MIKPDFQRKRMSDEQYITSLESHGKQLRGRLKKAKIEIQQQRERVEKLLEDFRQFNAEVRQKGVVPEASLEGLEISIHQYEAAPKELEADGE